MTEEQIRALLLSAGREIERARALIAELDLALASVALKLDSLEAQNNRRDSADL